MPAAGGLSMRKKCGDINCPEYYMCLKHDLQCYPCQTYCNATSDNFDANQCELQCQDYIHDFVRHYVKQENIQETLHELESLKSLIIFMTFLVAIALIFISITLTFIWKRERKIRKIKNGGQDSFFKKKLASLQYIKNKDKVKVNTVSEVIANNGQVPISMGGTALASTQTDMMNATASSSSSGGHRTNTTSANTFSSGSNASTPNKLPCEDATLEFSGYDNFALKVSPVLGKTMIGTTDLFQQYNTP